MDIAGSGAVPAKVPVRLFFYPVLYDKKQSRSMNIPTGKKLSWSALKQLVCSAAVVVP
jgi:hypothetical protein